MHRPGCKASERRRHLNNHLSGQQDQALSCRIYLLREMGPTGFLLREEEPENRDFRVITASSSPPPPPGPPARSSWTFLVSSHLHNPSGFSLPHSPQPSEIQILKMCKLRAIVFCQKSFILGSQDSRTASNSCKMMALAWSLGLKMWDVLFKSMLCIPCVLGSVVGSHEPRN